MFRSKKLDLAKWFGVVLFVLLGLAICFTLVAVPKSIGEKPYALAEDVVSDFASGDGTEGNPYMIATPEQLRNVGKSEYQGESNAAKVYFKLQNDIDLTDYLAEGASEAYPEGGPGWNNGKGWEPIGKGLAIGTADSCFCISLDGGGFTVSGLWQNYAADYTFYNQGGLFAVLSYCDVKNLSVITSDWGISVARRAGILAAQFYSECKISNCYFEGKVENFQSGNHIGLVAGNSFNGFATVIENVFAKGTVIGVGGANVGGFIGVMSGGIAKNVGVVAKIYSNTKAGALFGEANMYNPLTVENAYAAVSKLEGKDYSAVDIYGIASNVNYARDKDFTTINVYFADNDGIVKKDDAGVAVPYNPDVNVGNDVPPMELPDTVTATQISVADRFKKASYDGFDFDSAEAVWSNLEGVSYPYIAGFPVYKIKLDSAERRYSGVTASYSDLKISTSGWLRGIIADSSAVLDVVIANASPNAGTYSVTVAVKDEFSANGISLQVADGLKIVILKMPVYSKPTVEIEKIKASSVTLKNSDGLEYSIDGGNTWTQELTGLKQNKKYTALARFAENDNYFASEAAEFEFKTALSGGAIAGIVIGSIVGAALLGFAIFMLLKKGKKPSGGSFATEKATAVSASNESVAESSTSAESADSENNPWKI